MIFYFCFAHLNGLQYSRQCCWAWAVVRGWSSFVKTPKRAKLRCHEHCCPVTLFPLSLVLRTTYGSGAALLLWPSLELFFLTSLLVQSSSYRRACPSLRLSTQPSSPRRRTHRQHQQFPKSPGSSGGPSPPLDTPRLRHGALTPASPVDTSTSPPTSDVGMDLGQISAPTGHTHANASGQGTVSRSSSFSTGSGGVFGEHIGDRALAAQLGLVGRGPQPSVDR